MVRSFRENGFGTEDCEFLYFDNSRSNACDAYQGLNLFLNSARGEYIILCHQDILLIDDGRATLEARLSELDHLDSNWALCGNAGGTWDGRLVARISDPHMADRAAGPFPSRVTALDENFILVRRAANLAVSHDLSGFHLYGADLCIVADVLGCSAYVIDFHLLHKSGGNMDEKFYRCRADLMRKYARAFRRRWVVTTCTSFMLAHTYLLSRVLTKAALNRRLKWRWSTARSGTQA